MDKNKAIDIIENIVRENFYKNNHQDLIYIIGDIHFLNTISPIFGRCTKVKRHVYDFYFNIPVIEKMTEEQVRELAIHEVAHAIHQMRYNQHGHTKLFFDICKELGSKNPSTYWEEKLDSCYMIARYVYKCPKCGAVYTPTMKAIIFAPHIGRSRWMKCPYCSKSAYHKKVLSK